VSRDKDDEAPARYVAVGAYATRSEAELAETALAAAGISAVIEADDAGGAFPFALAGAARLLVLEADADDARAILQSGEETSDDPRRD
jgi:hypothetical protein